MKFMLMMQGTASGWESLATWKPHELKAHIEHMFDLNRKLVAAGELVLAEGLDMPSTALIVKAQPKGPPAITDGPFPESKEFLAGFWIVDVASRARAIEIAALASAAPGAGGKPMGIPIEVRSVGTAPEL